MKIEKKSLKWRRVLKNLIYQELASTWCHAIATCQTSQVNFAWLPRKEANILDNRNEMKKKKKKPPLHFNAGKIALFCFECEFII